MQIVLSLGAVVTPALVLWGWSGAVHGLEAGGHYKSVVPGSINLKNQLAFTKQHLINWVCTFSCTAACVRSALPAVAGGDVYLPPSRQKAGTL